MQPNNLVEKIVNIVTGDEIIRPYTEAEIAAVEAEQALAATEQTQQNAAQALKDAARQVVLDKLGLTADEVAALLN